MIEDTLKNTYDVLSESFDMGDYNTFLSYVNTSQGARQIHDELSKRYDTSGFEKFASEIGHPEFTSGEYAKMSEEGMKRLSTPLIPFSGLIKDEYTELAGTKGYIAVGANSTLQLLEGLTSPFNLILMGANLLPVIGRLATAAFTVEMARGTYLEGTEAIDAYKEGARTGDYRVALDHIIKTIGSGLFTVLGTKHLHKTIKLEHLSNKYKKTIVQEAAIRGEEWNKVSMKLPVELDEIQAVQKELLDNIAKTGGKSKETVKIATELFRLQKDVWGKRIYEDIPEKSLESLNNELYETSKERTNILSKKLKSNEILVEGLEDMKNKGIASESDISVLEKIKVENEAVKRDLTHYTEIYINMKDRVNYDKATIKGEPTPLSKDFVDELRRTMEMSQVEDSIILTQIDNMFDKARSMSISELEKYKTIYEQLLVEKYGLTDEQISERLGIGSLVKAAEKRDKIKEKIDRERIEIVGKETLESRQHIAKLNIKKANKTIEDSIIRGKDPWMNIPKNVGFETPKPRNFARYPEYVPELDPRKVTYDYKADLEFNKQTDILFVEKGLYGEKKTGVIGEKYLTIKNGKLIVESQKSKTLKEPSSTEPEIEIIRDNINIRKHTSPFRNDGTVVQEPTKIYDANGNVYGVVIPEVPSIARTFSNVRESVVYIARGIKLHFQGAKEYITNAEIGIVASEAGWAKAKPLLKEAWKNYNQAGKSMSEFVSDMNSLLGRQYMPLLTRFVKETETPVIDKETLISSAVEKIDENRKAADREKEKNASVLVGQVGRLLWGQSAQLHNILESFGEEGRRAVVRHSLRKGASGYADRVSSAALDDIESGLFKNEIELLQNYILMKRVDAIDRYIPDRLYAHDIKPEEARAYIADFGNIVGTDIAARVYKASDKYFNYMRELGINLLRDEQVITKSTYEALVNSGVYSPKETIDAVSKYDIVQIGDRKINVKDSRIKALTEEGSTRTIEPNHRLLLEHVAKRTQKLIMDNRANRALYDFALAHPENSVARIIEPKSVTKTGVLIYPDAPKGYEYVSFMTDGIERKLAIERNTAIEWVQTGDPINNRQTVLWLEWLSLSKPLKAIATGYNPLFGAKNLSRDFLHLWLTPEGLENYSVFIPIKFVQAVKDYSKVALDAWRQEGKFVDAAKEGMLMEWLSASGESYAFRKSSLGKGLSLFSKIGNFTEVWTRLALYERVLKNKVKAGMTAKEITDIKADAAYQARNYMDFADGGSVTKLLNHIVPYSNPSVQGVRGIGRGIYKHPLKFAGTAAQMLAGLVTYHYAMMSIKPDAYEDLRDSNNTINIPIPGAVEENEMGHKIYSYFKVTIDQSLRPLNTFARGLAEMLAKRDDVDWSNMDSSLAELALLLPEDMGVPIYDMYSSWKANYDSYRKAPIWRGRETNIPGLESNQYIHPVYRSIGEHFNFISPARLQHAIDEIITPSNNAVRIFGNLTWMMFDNELDTDTRKKLSADIVKEVSLMRGFVGKTNPISTAFKEMRDDELTQGADKRIADMEFEDLFSRYYKNQSSENAQALIEVIMNKPLLEQQRLKEKFKREYILTGVTDKGWWRASLMKSPKVRASTFISMYKLANVDGKHKLISTALALPGYVTLEFKKEIAQLDDKIKMK